MQKKKGIHWNDKNKYLIISNGNKMQTFTKSKKYKLCSSYIEWLHLNQFFFLELNKCFQILAFFPHVSLILSLICDSFCAFYLMCSYNPVSLNPFKFQDDLR